MGIDLQVARSLVEDRNHASAARTGVMLGRQKFSVRDGRPARLLRRSLGQSGLNVPMNDLRQEDGYSETFLSKIGFPQMDSMDYSAFEGCNHVHDLNTPPPDALRGAFDVIIDGGTIEHVFNTPQALDTVFHMLRPGGVFYSVNGMTGWAGHGFYQFSPELVWRYWQDMRNCTIHRCAALPVVGGGAAIEVPDTGGTSGRRFRGRNLEGRWYLYYVIQKTDQSNMEETIGRSFQGDYAHKWSKAEGTIT